MPPLSNSEFDLFWRPTAQACRRAGEVRMSKGCVPVVRAAGKRRRVGASGEMAVVRFAAFAAGESVGEVSMVGGVHVLAGNKRNVAAEEERVVAQRDERGERRERREQRRAAVAQRAATIEPTLWRRRAVENEKLQEV